MRNEHVGAVLLRDLLRLLAGVLHADGHAEAGGLRADDVAVEIVAHVAGARGIGAGLLERVVVDGGVRLADEADGGLLHALEVGAQTVAVEPLVHFLRADEVAHDGERIAAPIELLDGLDAAVRHDALALGLAVGVGHLVGRGLHALAREVVGQPARPQHLDRGLAVETQRPLAVLVVARLDDVAVERDGVALDAEQIRDPLLGLVLIGLVLADHAEGIAEVDEYGVDLSVHVTPHCRIGRSRMSRKRCTM